MNALQDLLTNPDLGLIRQVRQSQLIMALSVEKIIAEGGVYEVEAPVGVGKTYAYLLPAMLTGKRVVVSTPKKSLQDQIVNKDLPALLRSLGKAPTDVLCLQVKGKGNYTCQREAAKHQAFSDYKAWVKTSRFGDKADYPGPTPPWWNSATAESCIGQTCEYYGSCGYAYLRKLLAQPEPEAKVIIINHSLLGFDFRYGAGTLVGGPYDTLIIDEAHTLADGIRGAYTLQVSERSANDLMRLLNDTGMNFQSTRMLETLWDTLFESVPHRYWRDAHERKTPCFDQDLGRGAIQHLDSLAEELKALTGADGPHFPPDIAVPIDRAQRKVVDLLQGLRTLQGRPRKAEPDDDPETVEMLNEQYMRNTVVWGQGDPLPKRFSFYAAPVHTGPMVASGLAMIRSTVLTSATLAVEGDFSHLRPYTGVDPTYSEVLPPAFDYGKQGVLYVPRHLPYHGRPQKDDAEGAEAYSAYISAVAGECARLIRLSRGNAFILTTANDEMERWTKLLKQYCPDIPIFMQEFRKKTEETRETLTVGDGPPALVLRKYMTTPGSVLMGSKSFWEGIDVQGEKLSLVIIPKIPFPGRNDPIIEARRKATRNAFNEVDLVDAIMDLRQGAGRLIRSVSDRGVVAILDARLWDRKNHLKDGMPTQYSNYGKKIIASLPFPPTSTTWNPQHIASYLPRVKQYFERLAAQKDEHGT